MPARLNNRQLALRVVAAALAAGYALLAAVGDGLHGLVCFGHDACCVAAEEDDCLFCHHETPCSADSQGCAGSLVDCHDCPEDSGQPRPHGDDCDVCRLLAQLKTASAVIETPAIVIWAPVPSRPESDPAAPSATLPATTARGPPIV